MLKYNNYHCHTHYSNLQTIDSTITPLDYVNRIKELGYGCLFTTEHGWQGNYLEHYELTKKENIPFRFGVEAYWVLDNQVKDRTNNHIIILAKNKNGLKKINLALSYANINGFYYKPRLSLEQILSLPKDDVFITTACLGFNGYGFEVTKSIILQLFENFKDNFMLEIQSHNTESQKEWNRFLLDLHTEYGINIIAGVDSHFIYEHQAEERNSFLMAKGIVYEQEEGWYLDFPSYETIKKRFIEQRVLTEEQIKFALNNTLIIDNFENIEFDKDVKVPNIFQDKTYDERVEHLKEIIFKNWENEKANIKEENHIKYVEEINKELNIIIKTRMADYFILNYYVIKKAKENMGKLTLTSRGSSPSFYINKLLGFTTIDRISSPVQLFPERFMSISRILQEDGSIGSLPDIDFNLGNPEVFIDAQRQILGENSSYYMIAFGKLKEKSALKTYLRAKNVDFAISNAMSKRLDEYEKAQNNTEEEIDILKYIDKQYIDLYNESKKYYGVIESASRHPCAVCSYDGNILEDIGVIKLKDEICTVIDGTYLDIFKYVKNDFLKVNVVDIIYSVFEEANEKILTTDELLKITENDERTWNMFYKGITIGLNQIEQDNTRNNCMKYKPKNISELSAFIAAIRPGFASMFDRFINRERFIYGIKEFDSLIQTEQMRDSWLLYQEQIMQTLQYAGFHPDECYGLIKAISKKKVGVVEKVKNKFVEGFLKKGNTIEDTEKIWKVIQDNSLYSFNSSHSLSVALDSLYGAYLKSHFPFEFYKVMLSLYTDNKDMDKVSSIKKEMVYFNISVGDLKFGNDNTNFIIDKQNNKINQKLSTVKFINEKTAIILNEVFLKESKCFPNIIKIITEDTSVNSRQLETLIKIGYFNEYGTIKKCLKFLEIRDMFKNKTYKKETISEFVERYIKGNAEENDKLYKNINKDLIFQNIWNDLENEEFDVVQLIKFELEFLGYAKTPIPLNIIIAKVEMVSSKNKSVCLKSMRSGATEWFKIKKLPKKDDILIIEKVEKERKGYNGRINKVIEKYEVL